MELQEFLTLFVFLYKNEFQNPQNYILTLLRWGNCFAISTSATFEIQIKSYYATSFVSGTDGSALTYENWNSGEPNNGGSNEHCANVRIVNGVYGWNDVDCDGNYAVVCEKYDGQVDPIPTLSGP
jgi:hypothetical protein